MALETTTVRETRPATDLGELGYRPRRQTMSAGAPFRGFSAVWRDAELPQKLLLTIQGNR